MPPGGVDRQSDEQQENVLVKGHKEQVKYGEDGDWDAGTALPHNFPPASGMGEV